MTSENSLWRCRSDYRCPDIFVTRCIWEKDTIEQASKADHGGRQVHVALSKLRQKIHSEAPLLAKHMNTIWLSEIELYFTLGDKSL